MKSPKTSSGITKLVLAIFVSISVSGGLSSQLAAAVNSSGNSAAAKASKIYGTSHKVLGPRRYKLVKDVRYKTRNFGRVILKKGFVSDGSTSPIPDVIGSLYAGFLHDALYQGSPYLRFLDKKPKLWTKSQADNEYCYQLKRLGVKKDHRQINCSGVKLLAPMAPPWSFRSTQREKFWASQGLKLEER